MYIWIYAFVNRRCYCFPCNEETFSKNADGALYSFHAMNDRKVARLVQRKLILNLNPKLSEATLTKVHNVSLP